MRLQFKKTKGHKMFFVQKRDIQNMRIPYENKLPRLKNIYTYIYIYISRVEFGIPNNELPVRQPVAEL